MKAKKPPPTKHPGIYDPENPREPQPPPSKSKAPPGGRPPARAAKLGKAKSRLDWLRAAKTEAEGLYARALEAESFVAAQRALREANEIGAEIVVLEKATPTEPQSEAEVVADLTRKAQAWPVPYLEIVVREYLARHPGLRLVQDGV